MKRLLLLIIILFISVSAVSAAENVTDDVNDNVLLIENEDIVLESDSADVDVGDSQDVESESVDVVSIEADDLVWYYKASPVYKFKLVDSNGTGVKADNVSVIFKDKVYTRNTDENGTGYLNLNLKAGKYQLTVKYGNATKTSNVDLFSSRISHSKDISTTYGTKVKYNVRVLDNAGKPMKDTKVTFKINKDSWVKKTNSNGYATLYLNKKSGKYTIKYSTNGFSGKNKYTVKNYVSLKILKWGLTGDVSKASLIKNNMPNNVWVKKAVAATKKGLPLLTIKGSKGKVVFMSAGVHGNELNSQVAAMKMIKYLTTHSIKGTVYFVPFVNVKAISQGVRLTEYDFNRVAHVSGTVSNKLVNLVLKYKCDAYGDFHTTVSPGVPGINVVLGYTSPSKCVPMTKYISNNAKVNRIFYYPGEMYRWSLADWVNSRGTPAVICEVISPVNVVSAGATSLSYKEMTSFLKYNKIL